MREYCDDNNFNYIRKIFIICMLFICAAPDVRDINDELVVHDVDPVKSTVKISFRVGHKSLLTF